MLLLEASLSAYGVLNNEISLTAAIALSIVSITLFYWVILVPPFTHGKKTNALRLLGNTIISSVLMIGIFAIWYRKFGIQPEYTALDAWYFSTVTFSTLGFGDFTPKPYSQIFAAIQAVLGNLHLGFIVGSTLFATSQ
ncbi:MAG: ion channel [Pseudomonadota bacterium]